MGNADRPHARARIEMMLDDELNYRLFDRPHARARIEMWTVRGQVDENMTALTRGRELKLARLCRKLALAGPPSREGEN